MSLPQVSPSFCTICYKGIKLPEKSCDNSVIISKFMKFLLRMDGDSWKENQFLIKHNYDNGVCKLCDTCESIIACFCELYQQIKYLEMQLESKLDKIVGKIELSNRIPTRWITINNALQLVFQDDLEKIKDSRNDMMMIRDKVIKSGRRRLSASQPRVSLERYDDCTNIINRVNSNTLFDEAMPLLLPIPANCEEEPLNSLEDTTLIKNETTINSTTAITTPDPLVQIKFEHPQSQIIENESMIIEQSNDSSDNAGIISEKGETIKDSLEAVNVVFNIPSSNTNSSYKTKWACLLCEKVFRDGWNLKRHMMLVHQQKFGTNWKCGKCNKQFIDKWYLTHHLKSCGLPKKIFFCCGRQFVSHSRLKTHIAYKHAKDKASIDGDNDEPVIRLKERHSKRKKSGAASRDIFGSKKLNGGGQGSIKINNCFKDAVNAVYTSIPKPVELKDPLE